jgi:hypothetical protein
MTISTRPGAGHRLRTSRALAFSNDGGFDPLSSERQAREIERVVLRDRDRRGLLGGERRSGPSRHAGLMTTVTARAFAWLRVDGGARLNRSAGSARNMPRRSCARSTQSRPRPGRTLFPRACPCCAQWNDSVEHQVGDGGLA